MLEWFSHIWWWISQYISFEPSQSRWGIFALLFAMSIFLLEGSSMIQRWAERHKIVSKILFVMGCFFAALTLFVGVLWLAHGSADTTASDIQEIKIELKRLDNIERSLNGIEDTLDDILNELKGGE
jgi:predicted PurR-regulated permease PerM